MTKKRRGTVGAPAGNRNRAILTERQEAEIVRLYETGKHTQAEIAAMFIDPQTGESAIRQSTVSRIVNKHRE